jgi:predicted nucleic acid-binding Zn ribbon protein
MLPLPAPRECALCRGPIHATERSDKEFCSDACRSLNWQRKNRVPISAYTVEDFAEVLAVLAQNKVRIGRKAKLLGYSLRAFHPARGTARLGEFSFPNPNRKTKRFPDESGVARVRREPYFRYAPFEPARVPHVGPFTVTLHWDDGHVGTIGDNVWVKRAFPSVPYYDQEGNRYDLKGKLIPTGKSATPKTRKKYVPRRQSVVATDSVLPVEPTMLEYIRVAVARAVQAEREADRLRAATTQHPDGSDQATRLQALAEQVATLTAKLNAAEARAIQAERDAKEQLARVEARAVRAEALLVNEGQRPPLNDKIQLLEAQLKNAAARAVNLEQENFQMFQRLKVLERSLQQQASVVSAPTSATVAAASPPAAIKAEVPAQTATPAPPSAVAKPATVSVEQSVARAAGQAASPSPSAVRAPLHRKTLSVLKVGGRLS